MIIASRTPSKIEECIVALKADYPLVQYRPLALNLSSQKAVRRAADEVLSWEDIKQIDIVVNNAAVMNLPERELSEEGIEMHFATNHIGHFLFTNLIMPKIIAAAKNNAKGTTRIINVSSLSPTVSTIRWSDINFDKVNNTLPEEEQPAYQMHAMFGFKDTQTMSYIPIEGYSQSKVANVLYSIGLNRRSYEKYGILSLAVHPGIIKTELSRSATAETRAAIDNIIKSGIHIKTLGAGAATTVLAAVDRNLDLPATKGDKENMGVFLADCQINDKANDASTKGENADRLWAVSEDLVGRKFTL